MEEGVQRYAKGAVNQSGCQSLLHPFPYLESSVSIRPVLPFLQRLQANCPIILDGPTGTELTRQGVRTDLPLWSAWGLVEAPEVVQQIHRSYLDAGAEVITANTFRTHRRSLSRAGLGGRARELTLLAVQLARSAVNQSSSSARHSQAGRKAWVAGSIAPLEDCYSPQLVPSDEELAQEHSELVRHLDEAGVDLFLVETMNTVREARAATQAAIATGRPVLVAFSCSPQGRILSGETLGKAVSALQPLGPAALLINCTPARQLHRSLRELRRHSALPLGAYGNVGHADARVGWKSTGAIDPAGYLDLARSWQEMGACLIGGCCGTSPEYIAWLHRFFHG